MTAGPDALAPPCTAAEEDLGDAVVQRGVDGLSSPTASTSGTRTISPACSATICAERAVVHGVDGGDAEPGGQHAVERGRRAAALDVAEDRHPGLEAGARLDLVGERVADAAEPHVAELRRPRPTRSAIVPSFGAAPSATTTIDA